MHTELPAQIATIGGAEKEDNWFTDEQDENWCADEEEDGEDLDGEATPRRATQRPCFDAIFEGGRDLVRESVSHTSSSIWIAAYT